MQLCIHPTRVRLARLKSSRTIAPLPRFIIRHEQLLVLTDMIGNLMR